jgi:carboxymethylenebutenolidase
MPSFMETIKVGEQDMPMYASVPSGSGPFPAVIVAHHAGGVDQFDKTICDRLAQEGYAAVCPDLFHRITEEMVQSTGKTRRELLQDPEIVTDVNATIEFLQKHPAIDNERIGITGFCMGGRVVWLMAATRPDVFKAAVPYYGGNIFVKWGSPEKSPFELTSQIRCPILFHFGEIDVNPSQEDMKKLDAELTRLGKRHQFYTYPGADHAFMDFTGQRHHKEAADASWPRTLEFFAQHLKGAAVTR